MKDIYGDILTMAFCKTRLRTHSRLCIRDRRASCLLLLFSILIILYHDDASFVYIRVYQHIIFAQKILSMPYYRYIHCTHHRHIRYKERVEQRIYTCLVQIFCTHHFLFLVLFYININMYVYIVRAATHL